MNTKMKQDKAVKNVLANKVGYLPSDFEDKVMRRVFVEAEKKSKKNYFCNLAFVSLVAITMLCGTFYLLTHVYSFSILKLFSLNYFSAEHKSFFAFYFYIAFLVLSLLGLDYVFRQFMKKTNRNHSV
jgi:hypothetical protein